MLAISTIMLCAYDAYKIHGIQYWYNYILYNVTPAWFYVVACYSNHWHMYKNVWYCYKITSMLFYANSIHVYLFSYMAQ